MNSKANKRGWRSVLWIDYPRGRVDAEAVVARLKASDIDALFFLGTGPEFLTLGRAVERRDWALYVFLAGSLAGIGIIETPATFQNKIFLVYPTAPTDNTAAGQQEFNAFRWRHGLTKKTRASPVCITILNTA